MGVAVVCFDGFAGAVERGENFGHQVEGAAAFIGVFDRLCVGEGDGGYEFRGAVDSVCAPVVSDVGHGSSFRGRLQLPQVREIFGFDQWHCGHVQLWGTRFRSTILLRGRFVGIMRPPWWGGGRGRFRWVFVR